MSIRLHEFRVDSEYETRTHHGFSPVAKTMACCSFTLPLGIQFSSERQVESSYKAIWQTMYDDLRVEFAVSLLILGACSEHGCW